MTREEFFRRLDEAMRGFPVSEHNRIYEYYAEYWDEALEAGKSEADIAAGLESPEDIARRVGAEFAFEKAESHPTAKNVGRAFPAAVLAILAAPIALPVAIAILAALFACVAGVFAVAVGMAAVIAVLIAVGIALVVSGIPTIAAAPLVGLWMLGGGLLMAGLGLLIGLGCFSLIRLLIRLCIKLFKSTSNRLQIGKRRPDKEANSTGGAQ